MFTYFPTSYTYSSAINLCLSAGGQISQIDRYLSPLRTTLSLSPTSTPDPLLWTHAFRALATQQTTLADADVKNGYFQSASARYFRAATYFLTGERQTPRGDEKTRCYELGLRAFEAGRKYMCEGKRLERVEIDSPDGVLPGYIIPSGKESEKRTPVVIFYNGFDVTKELLYGIIREEFANRGIMCLVIDTPGTGEPLRLRDVASRFDYEVPTTAIVDYLLTRMEVDGERIGLVGISLGGYYAPRGAAFEKRIKAVVAWGAIWDYGKTWQRRWETRTEKTSVPFWQLPWVMGTETMEEALVKVRAWSLEGVLGNLTQPFLIVHGEEDGLVPMEDARKQFDAAGSGDKQLRVFSAEEGSCEHVGADDIDPVRQLVADWFAQRLGTATRGISSSH